MDAIVGLVREIKACEAVGANSSALAMSFVCIDAMAFLGIPLTEKKQTRSDFIDWVEKYLKADPRQAYQYRGIDVYGARCAMLHTFSSKADFHESNPDANQFGYHDGGKHLMSPEEEGLVLIGIPSFINDLTYALTEYISDISRDQELRARVESRMNLLLATFPNLKAV